MIWKLILLQIQIWRFKIRKKRFEYRLKRLKNLLSDGF